MKTSCTSVFFKHLSMEQQELNTKTHKTIVRRVNMKNTEDLTAVRTFHPLGPLLPKPVDELHNLTIHL